MAHKRGLYFFWGWFKYQLLNQFLLPVGQVMRVLGPWPKHAQSSRFCLGAWGQCIQRRDWLFFQATPAALPWKKTPRSHPQLVWGFACCRRQNCPWVSGSLKPMSAVVPYAGSKSTRVKARYSGVSGHVTPALVHLPCSVFKPPARSKG